MRIAVIGNCQTVSVANAVALHLPAAEVVHYGLDRAGVAERAGEIAAGLGRFDHVIAHPERAARFGALCRAPLEAVRPDTVFIPQVGFTGFHPDCVHLGDERGRLDSPLGPYHSLIAAVSFALGLGEGRAVSLFNALVYARLGYFEEYGRAAGALVTWGGTLGFALEERVPLWQRGGAFMLTTNHPRSRVMADLAWLALRRLGLGGAWLEDVSDMLGEPLARMGVFPVYPEIGRRLGVPGHTLFRGTLDWCPIEVMDLPGFVGRSFALYAAMPERVASAVERHPRARRAREVLRGLLAG